MSEKILVEPVELTDAELDLVTGGILNAGLVNADVVIKDNEILTDNNTQVAVGVLSAIGQRQ